MLEALASGVPVAAYPVMGPIDVIGEAPVGSLHDDLNQAIDRALNIAPTECRHYADTFSWKACAEQFRVYLAPFA
jgi:glycosyltransferase involved in cell wall biosynthesis